MSEDFEITPQQFFDTSSQNPELIQKAVEGMEQLDESDLLMLLGFISRLLRKQERRIRTNTANTQRISLGLFFALRCCIIAYH